MLERELDKNPEYIGNIKPININENSIRIKSLDTYSTRNTTVLDIVKIFL